MLIGVCANLRVKVLKPLAVPLEDVRGTRVPFHPLIYACWGGLSAEAILEVYARVRAEDLYALLAYYLRHRAIHPTPGCLA